MTYHEKMYLSIKKWIFVFLNLFLMSKICYFIRHYSTIIYYQSRENAYKMQEFLFQQLNWKICVSMFRYIFLWHVTFEIILLSHNKFILSNTATFFIFQQFSPLFGEIFYCHNFSRFSLKKNSLVFYLVLLVRLVI